MPAKKFIIPFAATGDKTAVPNTLQPDGTVSYAQGFGPDYELDKTLDPINAKDVPRDQINQLYFDLTGAVGEQQLYGVALWGADRAPYPLNARVYHNDKLWRSSVINNSGEPGVSGWEDVSVLSDTVNSPIATVAAASTIDLAAGAPNTSQIAISGTGVTITGFTVASGRCYFVRFTGALTLTNSASLVTQTGANIATAAGDTCIIRATTANVVEVMVYVAATVQSLTSSGYRKLKDGLIIQWCFGNTLANNGASIISLPVTFPSAFLHVYGTPSSANNATSLVGAQPNNLSSFVLSSNFSSAVSCSCLAIGY